MNDCNNIKSIWIKHSETFGNGCVMEYFECKNCYFTSTKSGYVCPNCGCNMENGSEHIYYNDVKRR
jgi:hypothetical protein